MMHKEYTLIGEELYSEKLRNGLQIHVIPKRGFNKSFAFFATNYGGADRRFRLNGEWIDTPEGVAHFLEHKMFDTKDGNALTDLSANGASPNAFTSSDITAYHFESIEKFEDNLKILLSFVSVPYFTPESVQKEQGIIGQEIRMVEDEPEHAIYYGLMKSLYKHNPVRDSVAGTVESIAEITADTLYSCHKVFYNPSNMVLCVAGDVDPEMVITTASNILPREAGPVPARDYGPEETLYPEVRRTEKKMEVSQPLFLIGAKASPVSRGEAYLRRELIAELALQTVFGRSSPLYAHLYSSGMINNDFSAEYEAVAGIAYSAISGESSEPDKVFDKIQEETERVIKSGLDDKLFERIKKASIGSHLRALNSFDSMCYNYARGSFKGFDIFDEVKLLSGITIEDTLSFIKSELTPDKMAISIISPS